MTGRKGKRESSQRGVKAGISFPGWFVDSGEKKKGGEPPQFERGLEQEAG